MNDPVNEPTEPGDEEIDCIFEMPEGKPARLSAEDIDNLEKWWRDTMRT